MKKITIPADPDDPEDFDVTEEDAARGHKARIIRMARQELGLSQAQFAEKFGFSVRTLQEWEQARADPPDYAVNYIRIVQRAPGLVAELLAV